ncbi:MAG TPA: hypothetical protein VN841_23050 [Bryobacteraceae bacterium]|nr:hypothetical protein [Bryobacteraceae bacterium]
MNNPNLLLKFKLAGDSRIRIQSAARIKVTGSGDLILYDSTGDAEAFDLSRLEVFSIQLWAGGHAENREFRPPS